MEVDPQTVVTLQWDHSFELILGRLDEDARVKRISNAALTARALLHLLQEGATPKAIDVFNRVVQDAASLLPNNLVGYHKDRLTYVPEAVEYLQSLSTL